MPLNLPIVLTWLRIAMIPLLVALYYLPATTVDMPSRDAWAAGAFVVAAVTDWLDGYLARRWQQTSAFGAFLDPVADKLMVSAALLILLSEGRVDAIIALIIIGREITISALREWMAQIGARASVAVNWLGKFKTAVQMTAIPFLLYFHDFKGIDVAWWGSRLIEVAAILTVWSMFYYLKQAWPVIRERTG
ncbi:CDP-diacylglycerol--glycerol-3-phosphate 3-phosphatidyltransferase [Verticiella sediminum]|uniref:CDP-diacylglycerol--glycerol-3-phosphate 3-phosphatidyltransferase n=1 Tax=Verticiella sediminum TaxID=1247510 RepID=A0A556AUA4_9BURK|nr:CDP-diacylglycerol--glycerol-3-phosphate 3-phosphatidyltransferase [Verticiella sediminum]TSH96519.1 CDP-diacylglycerol--glycerol-3-phosphate 3-phosphatidyltransferase [Verticiella sediminum]